MKRILMILAATLLTISILGCSLFPTFPTTGGLTTVTTITSSTMSQSTGVSTTTAGITTTTGDITTTVTTTTETTTQANPLSAFIEAAEELSDVVLYGHIYEKTQSIDGLVIFRDYFEKQIVTTEPLLATMHVERLRLNDFDAPEQFEEQEYDLYYFADQIVKSEEGVETPSDQMWSGIDIDIVQFELLDETDRSMCVVNGDTLICTIPASRAAVLFDTIGIGDVVITLQIAGTQLSSISLRYTLDGFSFEILHQFVYDPYTDAVMDGHLQ
jgi:hypothetical protein